MNGKNQTNWVLHKTITKAKMILLISRVISRTISGDRSHKITEQPYTFCLNVTMIMVATRHLKKGKSEDKRS